MSIPIETRDLFDAEAKTRPTENLCGAMHAIDHDLFQFRTALTGWFRQHGRDLPWRRTRDPYSILVSEIMLQQTQVATVVDYYVRWMARFPDPAALAAAQEQDVLQVWQGLGYYSRARNLHQAAKCIMSEHGGVFPSESEGIRGLPGVGRYTAGAVATFAFDKPTPPVDGNIVRVIARLIDSWEPVDSTQGLELIWSTATRWQPDSEAGLFNESLMELGALICSPRSPACLICPISRFCCAQQPESLPVKKPRPKTVRLVEHCGWVVRNGEVLLEQQTGARWRGLWKLPLLTEPHAGAPLVAFVYPFTNHRVEFSVYPGSNPLIMADNQHWFPISTLDSAPMPAPHRRALKRLLKRL